MKNPLAEWSRRVVEECRPKKPSLPRSIELKPGDHTYIILYDYQVLSRAEMAATQDRLHHQGIKTIFVGCLDPTRDMTMLRLAPESPAVPGPDGFSGDALTHTT